MNKIFAVCLLAICLLTYSSEAWAVSSVSSDNYQIDWPNLNMGAGLPSAEGKYKLGVTTGQTAPGFYEYTDGYRVRAGFQYIHSIIPFSFSISDISIEFGTLSVGATSTETNTLTVSAGGAGGYQVTTEENKPLTSSANSTIPDTTCNGNGQTCDETTAKIWTDNGKYGFGFNMSGHDIPADFTDSTYFRQFADISGAESPQIVMSSSNVGKSRQATVTYKINISNIQAAGTYRNIIMFICTPSY